MNNPFTTFRHLFGIVAGIGIMALLLPLVIGIFWSLEGLIALLIISFAITMVVLEERQNKKNSEVVVDED